MVMEQTSSDLEDDEEYLTMETQEISKSVKSPQELYVLNICQEQDLTNNS